MFKNNVNAVKILLKADFDIIIQTAGNPYEWDGTVLHIVAEMNKIKVLELFLKYKDIKLVLSLPSRGGDTPLTCTALKVMKMQSTS